MKKIYNLLFLLTALMTYSSCTSEVDDVFDKSSSERIEETMSNTNAILKANTKGWIMKYYANTMYGGYNVYCKFNQDKTVTVASEIYGDGKEYSSHYKFEQSQGAILSFDEYNPIFHFFSEPANSAGVGDAGKGMLGDFEFRIQSASNDSIVMLGKKHNTKIVMIPMAENSWSDYYKKIVDIENNMNAQKYALNIDGVTLKGTRSFNELVFTDPETNADIEMPIIVTPTGYELYKPIEYKGKTIAGFTYSEDELYKCSSDNSITLTKVEPTRPELIVSNAWYVAMSNVGTFGLTYFNYANAGATSISEQIYAIIFGKYTLNEPVFGLTFYSYDGAKAWGGAYGFNYKIESEDEITLEYNNKNYINGDYYKTYNYHSMAIPFGYTGVARTFKLTADDKKNPSYITMTDESYENNVIKLLASPVYFPFNK